MTFPCVSMSALNSYGTFGSDNQINEKYAHENYFMYTYFSKLIFFNIWNEKQFQIFFILIDIR